MSNETSHTFEPLIQDPASTRRPDGVPDSLWNEILEASQNARERSAVFNPRLPNRASVSLRHTPTSPRSLPVAMETTEDGSVQTSPSSVPPGRTDYPAARTRAFMDRIRASVSGHSSGRLEPGSSLPSEDTNWFARRGTVDHVERRAQIEAVLRRAEDHLRHAEASRAATAPRSSVTVEAGQDGDHRQLLESTRGGPPLQRLERQHDALRARQLRELRNSVPSIPAMAENVPNIAPAASNALPATTATTPDSNAIVERSTSARRDLERALRDYRIARRAFRTHLTNEPDSGPDQSTPPHQDVIVRPSELQVNNRNRSRVRRQSRSSTLDLVRTDDIVGRLAAVAGVGSDAWRSDDDVDAPAAPAAPAAPVVPADLAANRENTDSITETAGGRRSTLPVGVNATAEPYLGPTTNTRGNNRSSGGMRDFYQRIGEQHPYLGSLLSAPRVLPPATSTGVENTAAAVGRNRQRFEGNQTQRTQETLGRFNDALGELQARSKKEKPISSASEESSKNALRYLSKLKDFHNDRDRIALAIKKFHDDMLSHKIAKGEDADLPQHIDDLPQPQFSSWLEVGATWEGFQRGGFSRKKAATPTVDATGPLFEAPPTLNDNLESRVLRLRAWRHREQVRAERQEMLRNAQVPYTEEETHVSPDQMESLADIERHLTDLLEEEERRIGPDGNIAWRANSVTPQSRRESSRPVGTQTVVDTEKPEDQWPVKVVVHDVDWKQMTVQGTMVATQIGGRQSPNSTEHDIANNSGASVNNNSNTEERDDDGSSMETLFDGEIIDFHRHELETVSKKSGYKIGGLLTDIEYWARIGPFKEEVDRRTVEAYKQKTSDTYRRMGIEGTFDEQMARACRLFGRNNGPSVELSEAEINEIVYETMSECLASRKWLEKTFGEGGWILMRWKERCFITESNTRQSHSSPEDGDPRRRLENSRAQFVLGGSSSTTVYTTSYTDEQHHGRAAWGLTIRGFYYVALNRVSGKIEALYYDSGSHPYQELNCNPVGVRTVQANEGQDDDLARFMAGVSVRGDFGGMEFR